MKQSFGTVLWSLERHNLNENLWDHLCPVCRATTPVFVHQYLTETGRLRSSFLCETCARKKVVEWLRHSDSADESLLQHLRDFDRAAVYHQQENDEETLTLTRWSQEQRQRRLQGAE
jgi:protein-arginine kinase activator protein McsA